MSRTALVTGGTRGLGRAIVLALNEAGYRVAANYHRDELAAAAMAREHGILTLRWDVADFDACADGLQRVQAQLGPVDVLVNNAGITADAMCHKMQRTQWDNVLAANLDSVFNMCHHALPGMRERNYGRIVNISSVNARRGQVGQANYAAAKAGILGLTRVLALESASHNITVNAVAPGYCDTAMVAAVPPAVLQGIVATIPAGRLGTPADVARAVLFLVSDAASFVTGATLDVNGGQYFA